MTIPRRFAARFAATLLVASLSTAALRAGTPTFSAPVAGRAPDPALATAIGPVVADFDGDGKLDVATADFADGSVFLSLGQADGSAKSTVKFAGPTDPFFLATDDLDSDGKPDLLFAADGAVTYLLNDGATPFATPVDLASPEVVVVGVATGDFNGDGFPDIVASGTGDDGLGHTIGKLEIFPSTVDNSDAFTGYGTPVIFLAGAGAGRVAVGDVNGDGYPDVAVVNTAPTEVSGSVTVFFGDPDAVTNNTDFLVLPQEITLTERHPVGLAIGDLTQDGQPDIVTTSYQAVSGAGAPLLLSHVDLLRNLDDSATAPTFRGGEDFYFDYSISTTGPGSDLKLADFYGDGQLDVAVAHSLDIRLHLLRFSPVLDENGAYQSLHQEADDTFAVNRAPHLLATADLNGDGDQDVVLAHAEGGGLSVLLNTSSLPEAVPPKAIQFAVASTVVAEGTGADVVVSRANDSTGTVTVKFTVGGTATPNGHPHSDYFLADPQADHSPLDAKRNTATLTFGPTEYEKHISFALSGDAGSEPDETIVLTLQTPTGDAVLGKTKTSTVTIQDSEPPAAHPANALAAVPSAPIPLTPQDKAAGVKVGGRTPAAWTFKTTQTKNKDAPNLGLKVQYSLVPPPNESWTDLPGGGMDRPGGKGTKWTATSTKVPVCSKLYFRTVTTADDFAAGFGATSAPYRVVASPEIQVTMKAEPDSDPTLNSMTHTDEDIVYRLTYKNISTETANGVVVAAQIPAGTRSANGSGSTGIQLFGSGSDAKAVYWNIGTVAPNGTGTVFFIVDVDTHLLDKRPKTPPLLGFSESRPAKFKKLADFSKKAKKAIYGALWNDPFTTEKPLVAGGPAVLTRVLPSLGISVDKNKNIAGTGDTITYTVSINNYAGFDFHEVKFIDRVPFGTALESVHTNDGTGNFVDVPITQPTPGTNPSVPVFQFGRQQLITWTLGTIPAKATRQLKFTVRTLFDLPTSFVDAAGVSHTAEVANNEFNLLATPPSGGVIKAQATDFDGKPARSLISAADPAALPQIGFVKEARGEGKGVGELPAPGGGDIETVLPGDAVEYTLHYFNTGGSAARGCVIQEAIADGATFTGFLKINGADVGNNQFVFRDKKGVVLPYQNHTLAQDLTQTKLLEFRLGDLAAGAQGTVSYKVLPTVKTGGYVISQGYRIWSESLTHSVPGKPSAVLAKVVLPISFVPTVTREKQDPLHPGDLVPYTITFRNNGGFTASNVTVTTKIPDGTSFQSFSFPDARVTGTVEKSPTVDPKTVKFTFPSLHGSEESTAPDTQHPDTGKVVIVLKIDALSQLPPALKLPGATFEVKAEVNGQYPSGALVRAASRHTLATRDTTPGGLPKLALPSIDSVFTRIQNGPTGPNLWAFKQYPIFVTKGQKLMYKVVFGNSGTVAVTGVRVGIQVPFGTSLDTQLTTSGYDLKKGILTWPRGNLAPHATDGVALVVNVNPDASYSGDVLEENSCYVASDTVATKGDPASALSVVPGPARTTVLSTAPAVAAWQAFGTWLQGIGSNIFGKGNNAIADSVHQFGDGSINTTMRGADLITLTNGAFVIQNGGGNIVAAGGGNIVAAGGGNIVAAGGGNIVAAGGGNIVAAGGGNIVAAGGGNIVAAGGGNLISVQGIGFCNQANLLTTINGIVAGGGGNIVAAGGGNLIRIDGGLATLIGLDGASLLDNHGVALRIDAHAAGIIAAGAGNIVAAGAGNIVAAGAGNLAGSLLSSKTGFAAFVNPNGAGVVSVGGNANPNFNALIGNDGATLIGNDGATLIGNDGAGLIGNDGAGFGPVGP